MPKIKMQTEFDVPDDVFEQGIENAIKNNPDYVLVVRCKDCKHKRKYHCKPTKCYCSLHERFTLENNFCQDGERRSDDG